MGPSYPLFTAEARPGVWASGGMGVFKAHRASRLGRRPFWVPVFLPTKLQAPQTHAWRHEVDVLGPGPLESESLSFLRGKDPRTLCLPHTPQVPKSTEAWSHHLPSGHQVFY